MHFKWRKVVHKPNKINSEANIEKRYQFAIDKIRLLRSQKVIINYFLIDIQTKIHGIQQVKEVSLVLNVDLDGKQVSEGSQLEHFWHFSDVLSEGRPIENSSPHGFGDLFAELILIGSHELCCILVEGVIGVGVNEEEDQPQDHGVHAKHGFPVCTQDIQTLGW